MPSITHHGPPVRPMRAPAEPAISAFPSLHGDFAPTALLYDGPWSRVYRARTAHSGENELGQYAVKIASPAASDALWAENMLRREVGVLQSVQQANLIALLGCRITRSPYYLLTPFLEGATLGDVVAANVRVPLRHALWVARQIAQALDALHTAGWMHADIKPANIHVAPSGHATLLDLGLAQRIENTASTTSLAAIVGTLKYTAPEWFCEQTRADGRSDLYSLGVVLYQLLAGRPPFVAPNAVSLIEAHRFAAPAALPLPPSPIAVDVRQLVARLLAKEPLRRPQSAGDLAQRLMRLEVAELNQSRFTREH